MARVRQARPATMRRLNARLEIAENIAREVGEADEIGTIRQALLRVEQAHAFTRERYEELMQAYQRGDEERSSELIHQLRAREQMAARHYDRAHRKLQERIEAIGSIAAEQERQASVALVVLTLLALGDRTAGDLVVSAGAQGPCPNSRNVWRRSHAEIFRWRLRCHAGITNSPGCRPTLSKWWRPYQFVTVALAELRRMQAQIVAGLRAAVLVIGADDEVRTANPAAGKILGDPGSANELYARLPALPEAVALVRNGSQPQALEAIPFEERKLDILVLPFGDDGDEVLVVADDVTDALETKKRLIQSERLAAIGRMAAHVTHEVRNPLSSIGLNVEMLGDELATTNVEAKALMHAIQGEIDRLTAITEEYLRLARLPQPRLEPEDVTELLRSIAHFVQVDFERRGVELIVELGKVPLVAVDEAQFRQAMLNLLRNAAESMPDGGQVHVRARSVSPRDGVEVVVEDRGEGIPAERRERIFDLFFTTKEHGTGLGLPLTQQIVVAHGGEIRCEVAPGGRGTRFEIWLPAAAQPAAASRPSIQDGIRGMT